MSSTFQLDPRLREDTIFITHLSACQLRLMDEARWLWLVLIPQGAAAEELHLLPPAMRECVMADLYQTASLLQHLRPESKINIGMLGNIVRQLHIHIIARIPLDANWPGPVWGYGARIPLERAERNNLIAAIHHGLEQ